MRSVYDEVPYLGFPLAQTHPDRLATLATLFGMKPAPVERCRVLELGCGDGGNLIPMALGLPESEFVGIDLAERPVAAGCAAIQSLGLKGITLRQMDLMDAGPELGEFDYIVAHGVYSWVPDPVRNRVLSICRNHLAPQGVSYISYNTYPGFHRREMFRGMMLHHVRDLEDVERRVREAVDLIETLAKVRPESELVRALFREELQHLGQSEGWYLHHDDLAAINRPVYFHKFAEHARRYRLQYLAEADFFEMQDHIYPPQTAIMLKRFAEGDILRKEQYLDFIKGRRFRQTLLCHEEVPLDRAVRPQAIVNFYLASNAKPVASGPCEEFRGARGAALKTDYAPAQAALRRLGEVWPRSLPFTDLLACARADNPAVLAEILFGAYSAGLIDLHLHPPRFTPSAGERPAASPLARLQVLNGSRVTSLRHTTVELEDAVDRCLVFLMDGSRGRAQLVAGVEAFLRSHTAGAGEQLTSASLDARLERLARQALLQC